MPKHTQKIKSFEIHPKLGEGGEIGLLGERWTIAVQEFRYRLGRARDHRFFAWIPRSALKHWHSAAEGNVSLGCNACLLLLSRHGRVHGVRASSRLSYSFFFPFFFYSLSLFLLFISPPISLFLSLSRSLSQLALATSVATNRACVYTHPSCVSAWHVSNATHWDQWTCPWPGNPRPPLLPFANDARIIWPRPVV